MLIYFFFFFSSRRRHTRLTCDWSSDVCSSDLDCSTSTFPCSASVSARSCSRRPRMRRSVRHPRSRSAGPPWSSPLRASRIPSGGVELARNAVCAQAFRLGDSAWGVQFHPEVTLPQVESWIAEEEELP